MNTSTLARHTEVRLPAAPAAARSALGLLKQLRIGTLTLQCPDGQALQCGSGDAPHAGLRLNSWAVFGAVLRSGHEGGRHFTSD